MGRNYIRKQIAKKGTPFAIMIIIILSVQPAWPCFDLAAKTYNVPVKILKAIAKVESSNNPIAVNNSNKNGTKDMGLMQINSLWLKELAKYNISEKDLLDPCQNIIVGAWILKQNLVKHGYSWKGIGSYHSITPGLNRSYAWKIYKNIKRLRAVTQ